MCPTSSFFSNIVIESSWMGAIWRPCSIRRGRSKLLFARLCACRLFWHPALTKLHRQTHRHRFWGSMKFEVQSLALCYLLRWIWCYPVFSLWNSACSQGTLGCMRVWYLATHHGHYTRGLLAGIGGWQWQHSASDEPQITANLKSALAGLAL